MLCECKLRHYPSHTEALHIINSAQLCLAFSRCSCILPVASSTLYKYVLYWYSWKQITDSCISVVISALEVALYSGCNSDQQSVVEETWHTSVNFLTLKYLFTVFSTCAFLKCLYHHFCLCITQPQLCETNQSAAAPHWVQANSNGAVVQGFKKNDKSCFWKKEAPFRQTCLHADKKQAKLCLLLLVLTLLVISSHKCKIKSLKLTRNIDLWKCFGRTWKYVWLESRVASLSKIELLVRLCYIQMLMMKMD